MMGFMVDRISEDELEHLARLLYLYAETQLDQFATWRLDTADNYGPVYMILSRGLLRDWHDAAFDPLPRPETRWRTGRFADVADSEQVSTREDVQRVIAQMRADLAGRGWREWENPTLDRFLEAMEAVLDSLPGRLASQGHAEPAQPDWTLIAQILIAATGYE
jgi:hypothetical protein